MAKDKRSAGISQAQREAARTLSKMRAEGLYRPRDGKRIAAGRVSDYALKLAREYAPIMDARKDYAIIKVGKSSHAYAGDHKVARGKVIVEKRFPEYEHVRYDPKRDKLISVVKDKRGGSTSNVIPKKPRKRKGKKLVYRLDFAQGARHFMSAEEMYAYMSSGIYTQHWPDWEKSIQFDEEEE